MATYKEIEVPDQLDGIIGYMSDVEAYREELTTLGQQWDLLTILCQMTGEGTDMTETRQGFKDLTTQLLGTLGIETFKKTLQQLGSKSQVAVDIVIRNLFERTADIGFLATDDDVREFLRDPSDGGALVRRFEEYVAKYSVYDNIILLDPTGKVLVQIDPAGATESSDPLVKEAIQTHELYVEVFRHSDLEPAKDRSLIYAYRVTESNDPHSRVLGVLCLCFRFENEMAGVFANLTSEDAWSVITLLDRDGVVIASSDKYHVPVGAPLELAVDQPYRITKFGGRLYLAKTCATKGYQGYMGPGWLGHAMLPLEQAFVKSDKQGCAHVDQGILEQVMEDPRLFSQQVQSIPRDAERIQRELDRAVWNGNIRQEGTARFASGLANKVLLWEISKTGERTKNVFERSIRNLHETVVSSILSDVEFLASLAIDIMDRNLYERANDCRWWALTSAFRRILAKEEQTADDHAHIESILRYINGLYTVYSNLFVYDRSGVVLAASSPTASMIGKPRIEEWARETLKITDSQRYSVSSFDATDLYGDQPTYIYGASITDPDVRRRVVGGIGIVFDSTPQFEAMLLDSMPRGENGQVVQGAFGVFADRKGRVISSTYKGLEAGVQLDIAPEFFSLANGHGLSKIVPFEGRYYAAGAHASQGYREFKSEHDSYRNDVISIILVPLGEVAEAGGCQRTGKALTIQATGSRRGNHEDSVEIATFYIGDQWLGVPVERVVEAVPFEGVSRLPLARTMNGFAGITTFRNQTIPVVHTEPEVDPATDVRSDAYIVVMDTEGGLMGVVVDRLGEIPEIDRQRICTENESLVQNAGWIEAIVKPDAEARREQLLILVDPGKLRQQIFGAEGFAKSA